MSDVVVRDITFASKSIVGENKPTHSAYISDGYVTQQIGQQTAELSDDLSGKYSVASLNQENMITIETGQSKIVTANISQGVGLHFDTDSSAIYFGSAKNFRIIFSDQYQPARLLFQYLDPAADEYVTKFSCAK